jgi:hypothetical protein
LERLVSFSWNLFYFHSLNHSANGVHFRPMVSNLYFRCSVNSLRISLDDVYVFPLPSWTFAASAGETRWVVRPSVFPVLQNQERVAAEVRGVGGLFFPLIPSV